MSKECECGKYKKRIEDTLQFLESDCCEPCKELEEEHCDECNVQIMKDLLKGE